MAKPSSSIGKAKKDAAFQRRLNRGQEKHAAKQARHANKATTTPKEEQK